MARSEVVRFNRLIFGKVRVELLYFSWYGNVQMNQFQQRSNFQPEMWNPKNIFILFFEVTSLSLSSFLPLSLSLARTHTCTRIDSYSLWSQHTLTRTCTHTHNHIKLNKVIDNIHVLIFCTVMSIFCFEIAIFSGLRIKEWNKGLWASDSRDAEASCCGHMGRNLTALRLH